MTATLDVVTLDQVAVRAALGEPGIPAPRGTNVVLLTLTYDDGTEHSLEGVYASEESARRALANWIRERADWGTWEPEEYAVLTTGTDEDVIGVWFGQDDGDGFTIITHPVQ